MPLQKAPRKLWHWIITISWHDATGDRLETFDGTVNLLAGESRQRLFSHLRCTAIRKAAVKGDDAAVVFFGLEPDEL
ncbi:MULTISPECIES: hypothetical protein [Streptomyces]|uniref:hypothetical protein n=1 Tax=Streptomyces TaxID=1883 RepID=UPI0033F0F7EA